jgi:hypothetical protein
VIAGLVLRLAISCNHPSRARPRDFETSTSGSVFVSVSLLHRGSHAVVYRAPGSAGIDSYDVEHGNSGVKGLNLRMRMR